MDKTLFDQMIADRRKLHKRPEEGWTEFETTWHVCSRLKAMGYEKILVGKAIINPDFVFGRDEKLVKDAVKRAIVQGVPPDFIAACNEYTGCIAVLETGRPGPVTAFRFDMDALCIQETDDPTHLPNAGGFASERPGFMHACGHDGHTAVGLAVAQWLIDHKKELKGTFKLIFQPAEEGVRGAAAIAASGILDDVNLILGSHCGGKCGPGELGLIHKGILASTKFDIHFTGTPSHAGNQPHKGHSALLAACSTSTMLVGISRHGDGATRVAVGKLMAGEGRNVTPVHALIQAEVRGETAEVNDWLCENVEHIVKGNAEAYQVAYKLEKVGEATTLIECPDVIAMVREVARDISEVKRIVELSSPAGSEDFTMLLRRVAEHGGRGAMFRWGCRHNGHHRADFDIQDTESMPMAFEVFTRMAQKVNGT